MRCCRPAYPTSYGSGPLAYDLYVQEQHKHDDKANRLAARIYKCTSGYPSPRLPYMGASQPDRCSYHHLQHMIHKQLFRISFQLTIPNPSAQVAMLKHPSDLVTLAFLMRSFDNAHKLLNLLPFGAMICLLVNSRAKGMKESMKEARKGHGKQEEEKGSQLKKTDAARSHPLLARPRPDAWASLYDFNFNIS
ncbi:hypothetical protein PIB30_077244 [Stylosanthes scabra]|uniref:Uncharacterized protein n=1 Tax=Stylosanthes scabra TaxID=79078 RepID=A0ABU6QRP9_9FABA|nr:hypothetical protein [Stylosanthes scabra]